MSPRHSSVPNTPQISRTSPASATNSSGRKVPHCQKCGRPRVGHPRSGCPFAESVESDVGTPNPKDVEHDNKIVTALGSMRLKTPVPADHSQYDDEEVKEELRARRKTAPRRSLQGRLPAPSLASLSTESSAVVARLLEPGASDDEDEEAYTKSEPLSKSLSPGRVKKEPKSKIYPHRGMPGTLVSPEPTLLEDQIISNRFSTSSDGSTDSIGTIRGNPSASTQSRTKPLSRSMSSEERSFFIKNLERATSAPSATVYTLSKADIHVLQASAAEVGFITHAVVDWNGSAGDEAYLIIGRDADAVESLGQSVQMQMELIQKDTSQVKRGSGFKAAAGGVVIGAAATFVGLAFS